MKKTLPDKELLEILDNDEEMDELHCIDNKRDTDVESEEELSDD